MSDARTVKPGEAVAYDSGPTVDECRRKFGEIDWSRVSFPSFAGYGGAEVAGSDETWTGISPPPPQRPVNHTLYESAAGVVGVHVCLCGAPLLFSARARGNGRCGPCARGAEFRTIAVADRVNHDPGDEDR